MTHIVPNTIIANPTWTSDTYTVTIPQCESSAYVTYAYSSSDLIKLRDKYTCNYCGTRYVSEKSGFIPNCKNCGARLEKEE